MEVSFVAEQLPSCDLFLTQGFVGGKKEIEIFKKDKRKKSKLKISTLYKLKSSIQEEYIIVANM